MNEIQLVQKKVEGGDEEREQQHFDAAPGKKRSESHRLHLLQHCEDTQVWNALTQIDREINIIHQSILRIKESKV